MRSVLGLANSPKTPTGRSVWAYFLADRRAQLGKRFQVVGKYNIGAWRSLVAHLHGVQGVGGSNPLAPIPHCQFRLNYFPLI